MTTPQILETRFVATDSAGEVTGVLVRPDGARALYVFGHGAGAGMRHAFMEAASEELAARGVATFRYAFPYMEQGKKAPNPAPILMKTVRSAVSEATRLAPELPLLAGGKSPNAERGAHLADVGLPMLFRQGDRDKLADLDLLRPLLATVRPAPVLQVEEGADHGFHVLKRSGRTDEEVLASLCDGVSRWVDRLAG